MAAMSGNVSSEPRHVREGLMLKWLRQERDEGTLAILERLNEAAAGTQ